MSICIYRNEQQLGTLDESKFSGALSSGEIFLKDLSWKANRISKRRPCA